jgi:tripeptidyl-peptidase-1
LFRSLVATLGIGLTLEVLASPLQRSDALKKREVPNTHTIHERHTPAMAQQWTKQDKLPARAILPIRIGLKQSNLAIGHDRLIEM